MIKLLIADDSALMRKLLGKVFSSEPDFTVAFARSGAEALEQLTTFAPDVITLDVHMPQMDGLACLDRIMIQRPCPVVMVSSLTAKGAEATLEALRLGAIDFVPKPSGAISLHLEEWAPHLIASVRSAAHAVIRPSLRLRERVRNRLASAIASVPATEARAIVHPALPLRATGDGLVLIGVSTGGPPALETILTALPSTFPWPILIAQHMPASFTGPLARRLDGLCAINVVEVSRSTTLHSGTAYIARGDSDLIVARRAAGIVALSAPPVAGYPWHPSADRLVRTAMEHVHSTQLVGVLLTGMGNDGAQAMTLLHSHGGRTIAESEESAVVWGMPGELVKANGADFVLPVPDIAAQLQALIPLKCR